MDKEVLSCDSVRLVRFLCEDIEDPEPSIDVLNISEADGADSGIRSVRQTRSFDIV